MPPAKQPPENRRALRIWVDADGCPREVREIVFRASKRLSLPVTLVANTPVSTPASRRVELVIVAAGIDAADQFIAEAVSPRDIVITADVPLAARVVKAGATAIGPRGRVYDESSISEQVATRNLLADLRDAGAVSGGPAPYNQTHKRHFANALDRLLGRLLSDM